MMKQNVCLNDWAGQIKIPCGKDKDAGEDVGYRWSENPDLIKTRVKRHSAFVAAHYILDKNLFRLLDCSSLLER